LSKRDMLDEDAWEERLPRMRLAALPMHESEVVSMEEENGTAGSSHHRGNDKRAEVQD
jgi:hypothetical protein